MTEDASPPDPRLRLLADWITIWQSEAAAITTDREVQETWQRLSEFWAGKAMASLRIAGLDPARRPGPPPAPGAAAPSVAPAAADPTGPRNPVLAELMDRVAALERERP